MLVKSSVGLVVDKKDPAAQWLQNQLASMETGTKLRDSLATLDKTTGQKNVQDMLRKSMGLLTQLCQMKDKEASLLDAAVAGGLGDMEAETAAPFVAMYRLDAAAKCLSSVSLENFGDLVASTARALLQALQGARDELSEASCELYRGGSNDWHEKVSDMSDLEEVLQYNEHNVQSAIDAYKLKEAIRRMQEDGERVAAGSR